MYYFMLLSLFCPKQLCGSDKFQKETIFKSCLADSTNPSLNCAALILSVMPLPWVPAPPHQSPSCEFSAQMLMQIFSSTTCDL